MNKKKPTIFNKRILIGISALILIGLSLYIILSMMPTVQNIESDKEKISVIIDELMSALVARDTDHAYGMFSPDARNDELRKSLTAMNDEVNYAVLDSYNRIEIVHLEIGPVFTLEFGGTLARVDGIIYYTNDYTGEFSAELVPNGQDWDLVSFHPRVPPAKYEEYLNREN